MRVPTISLYNQATYQLSKLTSNLSEANEVVSSSSRINTISDDPSGMAQVLDISSTMACLDQYQSNIDQAQTTLTSAETALDAMADEILELNLLCSQLANASASTQERTNAVESIQVYLESILDLANTESYGGYVFAGDENEAAPFVADEEDATTSVTYLGSADAVSIKTGDDTTVSLGCCGSNLFYEDEIVVDTTNNQLTFQEDPGRDGDSVMTLDATIPSGTYTREELAQTIEDLMTQASAESGYGVVYEVTYNEDGNTFTIDTDGSYDGIMTTTLIAQYDSTARVSNLTVEEGAFENIEIDVTDASALTEYTPKPEGSEPLTLTYNEDGTWTVENDPGYGLDTDIEGNGTTIEIDFDNDGVTDVTIDLNEPPEEGDSISFDIVEGDENNSILPDLGFDDETVSIEPVQSTSAVSSIFKVTAGENDAIDFTQTLENGDTTLLTAYIEPGTYTDPESYAKAVEDALEDASAQSGSRVNYDVTYDSGSDTFVISEDTGTGRQLKSFELLFGSGANASTSAASDLGFDPVDTGSGGVTGDEASWSIFGTLLDLKQALANDDVDGIERAMSRLDNHYESLTSAISAIGVTYDTLTATEDTITDTELTLTTRLSDVQDADTVDAIMVLNSTQTTYEAALSACSSIIGMSLVDYM